MDNASILFINTNLLLEHRKDWRFLYSSQTHARSLEVSCIRYKETRLAAFRRDMDKPCAWSWTIIVIIVAGGGP